MALASARENFREAFGPDRAATFVLGDGLTDLVSDSAELVLCNPPFHQQSVVGDFIAQRMFRDAKRVLQKGGELWIVGNRHLGYHNALKQLFGNVTLIDSNKKFVILKSRKV
jgi:16S rRNA (guanine1207-N2)-methyltransferase